MKVINIGAVIVGRNEEGYIANTLHSLDKQTIPIQRFVFIDDGSTDKTVREVFDTGITRLVTVQRIHRKKGGNIAGTPEFAKAFNNGIRQLCFAYNFHYILISGADAIYPKDYVKNLVKEFEKNPLLVVASGQIENEPTSIAMPRGCGRLIKTAYLRNFKNPYIYPSYLWEVWMCWFAKINGLTARSFKHITFESRKHGSRMKFAKYGRNFRACGYPIPMVLRKWIAIAKSDFPESIRFIAEYLRPPNKKNIIESDKEKCKQYWNWRIKSFTKKFIKI